jgi:hypothetical protein
MTRQAGYDYIEKRRYSYADRITWKTGHELNHGVYPLLYESIDNFTSSDHKPVRAAFAVKLNRNMQMVPRRSVNHLPSIADLGNLLGMTLGTAKSSENTTTTTTTTTTSNIPHSRSLHLMVSHIKCTLSQAPRPFKKSYLLVTTALRHPPWERSPLRYPPWECIRRPHSSPVPLWSCLVTPKKHCT